MTSPIPAFVLAVIAIALGVVGIAASGAGVIWHVGGVIVQTRQAVDITGVGLAEVAAVDNPTDSRVDYTIDVAEQFAEKQATWIQTGLIGTSRLPLPIENIRLYAETSGVIQYVRCSVNTAFVVGQVIIVDVNKNGTTIFTTQASRPQIAATTNTDVSDTPDITTYVQGDYFDIDVDQADSSGAARDLTCSMTIREPLFQTQ